MNKNDIVIGIIEKLNKTNAIVDLKDGWKGLIHISAISDYYIYDINHFFKLKNKYHFIIEQVLENKQVSLSWKKIMPRFLKDPFEFEIKNTPQGFKNLQAFVEGEIEND